jgi:hypothetical protein
VIALRLPASPLEQLQPLLQRFLHSGMTNGFVITLAQHWDVCRHLMLVVTQLSPLVPSNLWFFTSRTILTVARTQSTPAQLSQICQEARPLGQLPVSLMEPFLSSLRLFGSTRVVKVSATWTPCPPDCA